MQPPVRSMASSSVPYDLHRWILSLVTHCCKCRATATQSTARLVATRNHARLMRPRTFGTRWETACSSGCDPSLVELEPFQPKLQIFEEVQSRALPAACRGSICPIRRYANRSSPAGLSWVGQFPQHHFGTAGVGDTGGTSSAITPRSRTYSRSRAA